MKYYSAKRKKFKPGEIIFSENMDCDGMYIIDAGRVRVFKTVVSDTGNTEVELCVLGPKSMFGEMAMIDNSPRSASVQAVEPTECTVITRQIFEDQLHHIPPWLVTLIRVLVKRLRETNEKLRTTVEKYTSLPDDDTGSILTVDAEKTSPIVNSLNADMSQQEKSGNSPPKSPAKPRPNTIVVMGGAPPANPAQPQK
jgi:CRP-like cAMP-binding protein